VSENFDEHVRKSVPLYDDIQRMVVEISEWFIRDNSVIYDLGSSTGETILQLQGKHARKKNVRYIGIENSIAMIEIARRKCPYEQVQFLHQNLTEFVEYTNADFVTSLYTLQFLPIGDRRKVLQRIYNSLSEGGALVMLEKVRAENSLFEDIWLELYWDFKHDNGLNSEQVIQKAKSLRGILMPLTLSENINMLKEVGFMHIDTFMKWYNFTGIIAVKLNSTDHGNEQND
jgi:tRNA (cmo5U34)-methyltransferase